MAGAATVAIAADVVDSERTSAWRTRLPIFAAALVLRLTAAALFFGSVDTINLVKASIALAEGKTFALPYFPTVKALIWLGGVLAAYTQLPLPLCLKLVPIVFDSLMAVLIFDLVALTAPRFALRAGLLYASSPVALLINSFHGQWDSIALFFLLLAFAVRAGDSVTRWREFLFGVVFSISLLVKPIALPFLLLLPRRKGEAGRAEWAAAAGLLFAFLAAFAIYVACGYSVLDMLIGVTSNSVQGVQVFGLPFAPGLALVRSYRLVWVITAMFTLAVLYRRRRVVATDAVLLFYLFTLATTGLSPQYLLWPVPLLLVSRRLRLAAAYTAVAMLFLLLYYMNPWASYFAFENLAMFAPLRGFAWLLPPAALASRELLPWVHALGNVVFPACAATIAFFVFRARHKPDREIQWSLYRTAWYTVPAFMIGAATLTLSATIGEQHVRLRLLEIWRAIPAQYAMHVHSMSPSVIFVGDFGSFGLPNVLVILALMTAVWCAVAAIER
jgi:hypothetical protein